MPFTAGEFGRGIVDQPAAAWLGILWQEAATIPDKYMQGVRSVRALTM